MSSEGTLLSDLEGKPPVFNRDDDLVNKILADMNIPSHQNPIVQNAPQVYSSQPSPHAPPPPMGNGNRMISSPNPNTTYPHNMDPASPTAHLIGKEYPTAADFANVMHPHASYYGPPSSPMPYPTLVDNSKSGMYAELIGQLKQPLLVAIIVFLVSLPALNVLIGHYVPSLLRIGGDLTTAGLVVKGAVGGFLFWFIQKVLVPLMV
jgi:hypothetical protein